MIDGPANAVSHFAANAKSLLLKKKMQALDLVDEASSSGRPGLTRLVETKLHELVHRKSTAISAKHLRSSGDSYTPSWLLGYGSGQLETFSEVGIGEEMLLPGAWPLGQVSLISEDDLDMGSNQDFQHPSGNLEDYTPAAQILRPIKVETPQPHTYLEGVNNPMGMLGVMHIRHDDGNPVYSEGSRDCLFKAEEVGEDPCGPDFRSSRNLIESVSRKGYSPVRMRL